MFDLEVLNRARRARPSPRAAAVADEDELATGDTETMDEESDLEEIEDDTVPANDDANGASGKSRDWRDVEKLQEERRLRKLIADDLDFDLD